VIGTSRPLLSVHLMVLNGARVLGRALRSVAGVADELCLVDTGSTDGTPELARELAREYKMSYREVLVTPDSRPDLYFRDDAAEFRRRFSARWSGLPVLRDWSAARNLGLELCQGKYVLKLDADDEVKTPELLPSWMSYLDSYDHLDVLMTRYAVAEPRSSHVHRVELYTRLWRNRPQVRFREACHECVDWWRREDGSNWVPSRDLLVWDHRDSGGEGTRVDRRNFKVLLREYERLEDSGEEPSLHLAIYLASEAVEVAPAFALEVLGRWLLGRKMHPQDEAWFYFIKGECAERMRCADDALRAYARSAELGMHRAALRSVLARAEQDDAGWRSDLGRALDLCRGHYYPVGPTFPEMERARSLLEIDQVPEGTEGGTSLGSR